MAETYWMMGSTKTHFEMMTKTISSILTRTVDTIFYGDGPSRSRHLKMCTVTVIVPSRTVSQLASFAVDVRVTATSWKRTCTAAACIWSCTVPFEKHCDCFYQDRLSHRSSSDAVHEQGLIGKVT